MLPYVQVPHMDTSSRLFHKAQATIAKQALTASTSSPKTSPADRLFTLQQGAFFSSFCLQTNSKCFSDIDSSIVGDFYRPIIQRARDVVTNATMTEIMNAEPDGPTAFRDAIRQQIFALCTRLRVSLVVIDKLMALANSLIAKSTK